MRQEVKFHDGDDLVGQQEAVDAGQGIAGAGELQAPLLRTAKAELILPWGRRKGADHISSLVLVLFFHNCKLFPCSVFYVLFLVCMYISTIHSI